jgi:hypothetical protein
VSWQERVAEKVKEKEEEVESVVPRSYAAKLKSFLDRFLPYSLILLFVVFLLTFIVDIGASTARIINYINWALILYFVLRLGAAFRLASSDREFLKQHWFDALLIIPAFSVLRELKAVIVLEETALAEEGAMSAAATRNVGIAGKTTKIIRIVKRSLSL